MNAFTRREFLKASGAGMLVVSFSMGVKPATASYGLLPPKSVAKDVLDSWLSIGRDGKITVFVGKVDLGTGTKTALSQIAAEELSVPFEKISMIMGDTATTPDQWITGGALTMSQGGAELRIAAANARIALLTRASEKLNVPVAELTVKDGVITAASKPEQSLSYGDVIGEGFQLKVDPKAPVKSHKEYTLVGKSIQRVDIPGKVSGEHLYVHDFRLPGMLHARVIRSLTMGANLVSFDDSEAKKLKGYVQTVRKDNFLAVVCKDEWCAVKAAKAVKTTWSAGRELPPQAKIYEYWRELPIAKTDITQNVGDIGAALAGGAKRIKATYNFAVQTHASSGPSCAVADFRDGKMTLWSASQATHSMQDEIATLTKLPKDSIRLVYLDGSGCYGRNGHEDATADAALISQLIGKPVRVQWMRHDETALAPKSPPRSMDFEASFDAQGNVTGWQSDFYIALNHIAAFKPLDFPLLATAETGNPRPGNWVGFLFQNTAAPYVLPNMKVTTKHIEQGIFRSSHLRSPGRIENSFANESFMDELAVAAKADPAEFRLKHLSDPRALDVMKAVMKASNWQTRSGPILQVLKAKMRKGG